jgi:uncharacterized phage protein (TIGR02218 family)
MRTATSALHTLLNSKVALGMADLYTISLASGDVLRWASTDADIEMDGYTFTAAGPIVSRSTWSMSYKMEVPSLDLTVLANNDAAFDIGGVNIKSLAHNLGFDGAVVQLQRIFWPASGPWGDTTTGLGSITLFVGPVGSVQINSTGIVIKAKGANIIFNQKFPRNVYQPACVNTLFDGACTINRAANTHAATVGSGSNMVVLYFDGGSAPVTVDNLLLGTVLFTSGPNNGIVRSIKAVASSPDVVRYSYPLESPPDVGDTFTVTVGCDKTPGVCSARFSNLANFRGFPYVPQSSIAF